MTDQEHSIVVKVGDQDMQMTLADLGNVDITEVERFRMTAYKFPIGLYDWELKKSEQRVMGGKLCFFTTFTCIGVVECADENVDHEDLLGKEHGEMQFLPVEEGKKPTQEQVQQWLGMFKDLLLSIHAKASGTVVDIQQGIIGHQFRGPIVHQQDRKKPNVYYSRLDLDACTLISDVKTDEQAA